MDAFDSQMAARVWQRVRGEQAPGYLPELQELMEGARQDAAVFRALARKHPGKSGKLLEKLAEEAAGHAACLRGIRLLMEDIREKKHPAAPAQGSSVFLLRRCYVNHLGRIAHYESLAAHPEYGCVFEQLARQAQSHCRIILELIGLMEL